jgi:SAM-dependent methyltransferase
VAFDRALFEEWRRIARVNPGYVARLPHRYEGETGEEFFEELVRRGLRRGQRVLDVGCGGGEFTVRCAGRAFVAGVDPFAEMLAVASGRADGRRVHWVRAMGEALPFRDAAFDVVYSRRGPGSHLLVLPEVARVLRPGGDFFEITIGERNAREFARIFGRGQMAGTRGRQSAALRRRLRAHGLLPAMVREFVSTHVLLGGADELAQALEGSPMVPGVDRERERGTIDRAARRLCVGDGIRSTNHRVVVHARRLAE